MALFFLLTFASTAYAAVAGKRVWVRKYVSSCGQDDIPSDIDAGPRNTIYVAGSRGRDYSLIKYGSSGEIRWKRFYQPKTDDKGYAQDVEVDRWGNVYVAGVGMDAAKRHDYVIVKYSPAGRRKWARRFDANTNNRYGKVSLEVGDRGNIYIAGLRKKRTGKYEYVIVKYNRKGRRKWTRRINKSGENWWFSEEGFFFGLDQSENAYMTIPSRGEYVTVKYGPGSRRQWVRRYSGSASSVNIPSDMAVDKDGNVYVTGMNLEIFGDEFSSLATVKYDTNGNRLWVSQFNDEEDEMMFVSKLVVDTNGDLFVARVNENWGFGYDSSEFLIIKYNAAGDKLWARRNRKISEINGLATDHKGNVIVTGDGVFTIKYSADGKRKWTRVARTMSSRANSLAIDSKGAAYVTGADNSLGKGWDSLTVKYAP